MKMFKKALEKAKGSNSLANVRGAAGEAMRSIHPSLRRDNPRRK